MSAANPKTQEPSMEEILASIRRIIADDQETPGAPEPGSAPAAPNEQAAPAAIPEEDVLDLAEVAPPPAQPAPRPPLLDDDVPDISFREIEPGPSDFDALDAGANEREPEPEPERLRPTASLFERPRPEAPPSGDPDHLLSRATDASVGHAFNLLATTVLSNNARTLEDLVREMLRPLLKTWLDDNLPTVVERLVRAEIERVARGGR
jgi:cell pole-organizing protein PopZ